MTNNYIAIEDNVKKASIDLLQKHLSDAVNLYVQLKQAHWNVKGPNFISLHEMFDKIHEDVGEHVDNIAERIVILGGVANAGLDFVGANTRLPVYPTDIKKGNDHLTAILASLSLLAVSVREAIGQAEDAGDDGTADVFMGLSGCLDKSIWFAEAHLD